MQRIVRLAANVQIQSRAHRAVEAKILGDQAYWMVVSVNHKKQLAESYLNVVKKLDDDEMQIRFFVFLFLVYYLVLLIYDTLYFVRVEKKIHRNA